MTQGLVYMAPSMSRAPDTQLDMHVTVHDKSQISVIPQETRLSRGTPCLGCSCLQQPRPSLPITAVAGNADAVWHSKNESRSTEINSASSLCIPSGLRSPGNSPTQHSTAQHSTTRYTPPLLHPGALGSRGPDLTAAGLPALLAMTFSIVS